MQQSFPVYSEKCADSAMCLQPEEPYIYLQIKNINNNKVDRNVNIQEIN